MAAAKACWLPAAAVTRQAVDRLLEHLHMPPSSFKQHACSLDIRPMSPVVSTPPAACVSAPPSGRDGQPRQMAFVGYRTVEDAAAAMKYFNNTFIDTCRIVIEVGGRSQHQHTK